MFDTLGNVGDFVGGVGVVVTLVYLAVQIRQNTTSTRTESYQSVVAAISEWTREIGTNPDSSRIFQTGCLSIDELTESEWVQFNLIMAALVRNLENIHYQYLRSSIDDDAWIGWAKRTHSLLEPDGAQQWWRAHEEAYSPAFREFVNSLKPVANLPESAVRRT